MQISTEEGAAFARAHKIPFVETSAKLGVNVDLAFVTLTEQIFR